jgi:Kef-type K+ transport system membrane component KefB/Trk K+ transport system NAD-binding subunit
MNHADLSFFPLLVVLAAAFLAPIAVGRIKAISIPAVIGEILIGMAVGQSGLGLVESTPVLNILADLGFIFLMFLSGLEIDFTGSSAWFGDVKKNGLAAVIRLPPVLGVLHFGLTLVCAALAGWLLYTSGAVAAPWFMTLVLATTSLGVAAPVLKEKDLLGGRYGQSILMVSLAADFGSILLISVYVMLQSQGVSFKLLLILVLLAAFAAAQRLAGMGKRRLPLARFFDEMSTATSQLKMRGALVLALLFIVLADSVGTETILGAFLAGVIISFSSGKGSGLRLQLDAIGYGFLIPIFFVMVGATFNLSALVQRPGALGLVLSLAVLALLVKMIPALLFRLSFSWRETIAAGFLTSARLSLIIAASAIGLRLGLISEGLNSAVVLLAILTCLASPILFSWLAPVSTREKKLVLIIGDGPNAKLLARNVREHHQETVLLLSEGDQPSHPTLPPIALDRLRDAGAASARVVVAMFEDDEANLKIARTTRFVFGVEDVIAWVRNPALNADFSRLGVRVISPVFSTLIILEGMILDKNFCSITPEMDGALEVREVKLKNSAVVGLKLGELRLPSEVAVLKIARQGEFLVPGPETTLRANDSLTLLGPAAEVELALGVFA